LDALIERDATTSQDPALSSTRARLKILFAVASWGLGHATRDLPVIQRMLECGHQVTVVSNDRALDLLRQELGSRCTFLEWPDLPVLVSKSAPLNYARFTFNLPLACRAILAEYRAVQSLLNWRKFDRIISDNRFGVRSSTVTSFHLTHGLRFIAPRRNPVLELFMEYIYHRCYGGDARFVVPDFAQDGLSGDLSHNLRFIGSERIDYVGILGGIRRLDLPRDIDCYVSISGPEPQRTILEGIILEQVGDVRGRVVVSLGKPEEAGRTWTHGRAMIHAYVNRYQQQVLMNRAHLIVSRSGYTTMMELAELGCRALLIPTPGQTEQEYLADRHLRAGNYYAVTQDRLDLPRDIAIAAEYPGYRPAHRTDESIRRLMELVAG
jgi:hypothetical protein